MENKVIFTIFAGRKPNLEILFSYLQTLYKNKDIDEVHVWNFTRNLSDEEYIKDYISQNNIKKVYNDETIEFKDDMIIDKYRINIRDGSLLISYINNKSETEIKHLYVKNPESIKIKINKNLHTSYFTISYDDTISTIFTINNINNNNNNNNNNYMVVKYPGWKLFNVDNKKSWSEYYSYYANQSKYVGNDIIIKCDDDIVFIDTLLFKNFINRRIENQKYSLFVPNIINNGVCAYHQSQKKLIPMEMPYDTFYGKMVNDGKLANEIHSLFCNDMVAYLDKSRNITDVIDHKIGDRFSINFFAILAKHLFLYKDVGWDDEHDITVTIPKIYNSGIGIDMSMTVSHLGFSPQRSSGLDEIRLIEMYAKLINGVINGVNGEKGENGEKPKIKVSGTSTKFKKLL